MGRRIKAAVTAVGLDDWEVREDFQTVCRAKEIEKDPKRMARVQEFAKKIMLQAGNIAAEEAE